MRKSYTLTTKIGNKVAQEQTYYKVLREEDNKTVLGTVVDSDDMQTILTTITNDIDDDPLLKDYYGTLAHISFKQYPNCQTSVRLYFDWVDDGNTEE